LDKLVVNGSEGPRRALPDSALPLLRSSRGPTSQPPPRPLHPHHTHHHTSRTTHTIHGYRHTGTDTDTDTDTQTPTPTHPHTQIPTHGDSHHRTGCPGGLSLSRRPAVLICCVLDFETATGSRRLPAAPLAYTRRQPRCLALCATRPTAPTCQLPASYSRSLSSRPDRYCLHGVAYHPPRRDSCSPRPHHRPLHLS
jgi:hypothetical protein